MFEERKIAQLKKMVAMQRERISDLENENDTLQAKLEESVQREHDTTNLLSDSIKEILEKKKAINEEYRIAHELRLEYMRLAEEIKKLEQEAKKEFKRKVKSSVKEFKNSV